jgi:hypothetical protein
MALLEMEEAVRKQQKALEETEERAERERVRAARRPPPTAATGVYPRRG